MSTATQRLAASPMRTFSVADAKKLQASLADPRAKREIDEAIRKASGGKVVLQAAWLKGVDVDAVLRTFNGAGHDGKSSLSTQRAKPQLINLSGGGSAAPPSGAPAANGAPSPSATPAA